MRKLDGTEGIRRGGAGMDAARAQWRFFLRRERRRLSSAEMLRRDLRERKILGEGIVRRRGVEEEVGRRMGVGDMVV